MPRPPVLRESIKRLITELGPMTVEEIAAELGRSMVSVGSCIADARAGATKHFYIKRYKRQVGRSGIAAGIYAIGSHKDAPFPRLDKKGNDARWYAKHRAVIRLRKSARPVNHFTSLIMQVTA